LTSDDESPDHPREDGHEDRDEREERSRKELSSQIPKLRAARNVEAYDGGEGLEHEIRNGENREEDGRDRAGPPATRRLDGTTLIVHGV